MYGPFEGVQETRRDTEGITLWNSLFHFVWLCEISFVKTLHRETQRKHRGTQSFVELYFYLRRGPQRIADSPLVSIAQILMRLLIEVHEHDSLVGDAFHFIQGSQKQQALTGF